MFKILTGTYPFGVYLQAAVNVQNRNRAPWPTFMTSNPQYKPLSEQLQGLIEKCLIYEAKARPTAGQLVRELSGICYVNVHRYEGHVSNLIQSGHSGFATSGGDTIFFSMESVYGVRRPSTVGSNKICFSKFPGNPRHRGHPIVVID